MFIVATFTASNIDAASYQKTDGTIVDPILDNSGEPHSYSGANIERYADLSYAFTVRQRTHPRTHPLMFQTTLPDWKIQMFQ